MKFLTLTLLLALPLAAHPDARHSLEEIDEHLTTRPDDIELLGRKADLLLETGHPDLADPVIGRSLALAPKYPASLLLAARLEYSRKNKDAALAKSLALVESHPEFADGWNFLALLRHESGERDAAIAAKRRFLELAKSPGPGDFMACAAWMRDRGQPGDVDLAIATLDDGIARLGCLTGLQDLAIELETGADRTDAALRRVDALAARFRPSVELSLRRADLLEKAGRRPEAAAACDAAIALMNARPPNRKDNELFLAKLETLEKRKAANLAAR